jgi:glutamate-ammonia-ligase adenylyltransferase
MQQLLPLLLGWLSESPDPDLGLLGLRTLATGPQRSTELEVAFRESPEVARRLCRLLGTSRLLADGLAHNPDLIGELGVLEEGSRRSRQDLVDAARNAVDWRRDTDARRRGLLRFKERELLSCSAWRHATS